jgi:16S rRNA (guanine527-N7)-methyltransferase
MEYIEKLNLNLSKSQLDQLSELHAKFKQWNQKMNLVSKEDESKIWDRHILDSLTASLYIDENTVNLCDMGCGMGFPLLPLAITNPQIKFYGIEPRGKRIQILKQFIRLLEIKNITLYQGTAEEVTLPLKMDIVTCRAVGSLQEDWVRAQKHMSKSGSFVTFKSQSESWEDPSLNFKEWGYQTAPTEKKYFLISIQKKG